MTFQEIKSQAIIDYVGDIGASCMDCSKYDYGYCEQYQIDITEPYEQKCEQYNEVNDEN